jgi:hypothetical protein
LAATRFFAACGRFAADRFAAEDPFRAVVDRRFAAAL